MYLASSSTHVDHEAWLTNSGASFHFTTHREWFSEYEKYNGGDVFLGDDRKARIIGHGEVNMNLQGGRVRTHLAVLHIPALARNMISVRKLDNAGVKTMFEMDTCKMVQGALVLMLGVWIETLYKLQGSTVVDGCNNYVVPESGAENLVVFGEKGLRILHGKGTVEVTKKVVYNRDVVFKEVKDVIKHEFQPKELENIEFELKEEESDSTTDEESEDEKLQTSSVRRSVRERRQPERYSPSAFCSNFSLSITDDDPKTVKETIDLGDGKLWKEAMVDEMASLQKNEAWDLVDLPTRRKPIGNKWMFKKKTNLEGKVEKYKARLVAKGYSQVPGIYFSDIFLPLPS
eukprot:PITA_05980